MWSSVCILKSVNIVCVVWVHMFHYSTQSWSFTFSPSIKSILSSGFPSNHETNTFKQKIIRLLDPLSFTKLGLPFSTSKMWIGCSDSFGVIKWLKSTNVSRKIYEFFLTMYKNSKKRVAKHQHYFKYFINQFVN